MRLALTVLAALLPCLASAGRPGRTQPPGFGTSIVLEYSIDPTTVIPDQDVTLRICVTNQNVSSLRDVQPGDAFSFTFGAGAVGACGDVSVFSPDGTFSADDFACEALGPVVTLRFDGPRALAWRPGDMACTDVAYHSGTSVSNVGATMEVGNRGAFAPVEPAFIRLPLGAAGDNPSFSPTTLLKSTGVVMLKADDPPEEVPGLEAIVNVRAGARLEILADVLAHACTPDLPSDEEFKRAGALLEVDGFIVASRAYHDIAMLNSPVGEPIADQPMINHPLSVAWISEPLAAGNHLVRLLAYTPQGHDQDNFGLCVGSDADPNFFNLDLESRVIIHELPAGP